MREYPKDLIHRTGTGTSWAESQEGPAPQSGGNWPSQQGVGGGRGGGRGREERRESFLRSCRFRFLRTWIFFSKDQGGIQFLAFTPWAGAGVEG